MLSIYQSIVSIVPSSLVPIESLLSSDISSSPERLIMVPSLGRVSATASKSNSTCAVVPHRTFSLWAQISKYQFTYNVSTANVISGIQKFRQKNYLRSSTGSILLPTGRHIMELLSQHINIRSVDDIK